MLPFVPPHAHAILDVGCGDGSFGRLLKERGNCTVTGIEHVPAVAQIASTHLDEVHVCSIESFVESNKATFDCVVFNDVLEHLVEPWAVVVDFSRFLSPGGCIVASVPNVRYYRVLKELIQDGTWKYAKKGVLDSTHLRFFTKKTIPGLFTPAGLEIRSLEGINGIRRFPLKYALINWLSLGAFADSRYPQFACVAQKPLDQLS